MVRNFEELGGIAVYTRELLEHLLEIDGENEYYIFYGSSEPIGTYAHRPNVQEIHVPCKSKFLWDQAQVAAVAEQLDIDVMFSPKMSSPLLFRGRKVFAIHGAEQFVHAKEYPILDRLYVRTFLPWFAKTSNRVVALSHVAKHDLIAPLGIPAEKIAVTNPGTKEIFLRTVPEDERRRVLEKYGLDRGFLLHVGLVWGAKNFKIFPEVLDILARRRTVILAHAGKMRGWVRAPSTNDVHILELGFVPDEDLAALYQSAVALVFPSLYEGFGIPLLEAMASGCPVITTNWGAMKEVCGDAAILVDSRKPEEIAAAVERLFDTPELREELIARGRERAKQFTWERTARETLAILEDVRHEPIGSTNGATAPPPSEAPVREPVMRAPQPRRSGRARFIDAFKVIVSLSLVAYLLVRVDFAAVGTAIAGAPLDLLFLAFLVLHVDRILQGGKWWVLIRSTGVSFSFWQAVANTYAGNFAGQFLPSGVGGDVVRVVLLKRMNLSAIEVAASIVVERLFGLFALVSVASIAIGVATALGIDLPGSVGAMVWALFVLMAAGLVASFTPTVDRAITTTTGTLRRLPLGIPFLQKVDDLASAYRRYSARHSTLVRYFALSIAEVLLIVAVNVILCRALGIDIPAIFLLLIVPVTLILYRIPISVSGIGVQEGVFGYFFAQAGFGIDAGVTLSLVLRLIEVGIFLPGAYFIWRQRGAKLSP